MDKKKGNKKILLIITISVIAILLISGVILIGCILQEKKKQELNIQNNNFEYGNSSSNLAIPYNDNYGGYFVADSDYFYISSKESMGLMTDGIFKISKTGKEFKRITNGKCAFLNIYKDTLYYLVEDENKLYSCDLNGNNRNMLLEDVENFTIENNTIFYSSDTFSKRGEGLYSYDIDSSKSKRILSADIKKFSILKNKIYLTTERDLKLYEYDIYSRKHRKITDDEVTYFIPSDNTVYYISKTDGNMIYKFNAVTNENTRLNIRKPTDSIAYQKPFLVNNNNIIVLEDCKVKVYNEKEELRKTVDASYRRIFYIDDNRVYERITDNNHAKLEEHYIPTKEDFFLVYYEI